MVDGVRGIRVLDGEEANKYLEIINIFHNVAKKYDTFSPNVGRISPEFAELRQNTEQCCKIAQWSQKSASIPKKNGCPRDEI